MQGAMPGREGSLLVTHEATCDVCWNTHCTTHCTTWETSSAGSLVCANRTRACTELPIGAPKPGAPSHECNGPAHPTRLDRAHIQTRPSDLMATTRTRIRGMLSPRGQLTHWHQGCAGVVD